MSGEVSFRDVEGWSGGGGSKFGLTFKQIILTHINRCVIHGSLEMCGGYWNKKATGNIVEETYVPDSREVYSNSIKMLRALLLGYYDDKMEKADNELAEEYKQTFEKTEVTDDMSKEKKKEVKRAWTTFKIDWHIKLFEQLILLSKRENFFEEISGEEIM